MRRKTYSVNINDWLGGTRGLSDRAYRLFDELVLLIAEAGGRLAFRSERERFEVRKRLGCDSRKLFAGLRELTELGKLHLVDGWLVNRRALKALDVLVEAIEVWGWPRTRLEGELGIDPRDIDAALERHHQTPGAAGDKPVDRGDKSPPPARHQAAAAGDRPQVRGEVPGKSGGSPAEVEAEFLTYQGLARFPPTGALSSYLKRVVEIPSPVPRARDRGSGGLLGVGRPAGTPRQPGFRWGRPETAEWKLLVALLDDGVEADAAFALIARAVDVEAPGHLAAARECASVSHRHRCGWYPPRRIVN